MKSCIKPLALLVPLLFVHGVQAVEQLAMLDPVLVSTSRFENSKLFAPANVTVISRTEIEEIAAQSLPDVLSAKAGIFVSQLSGGALGRNASVDLRGFGETATSNTLILVDGQRLNPADMGTILWSSVPLGSVDRIEIVRGSGSVLFGDGATGGVINIITNKSGKPLAEATATIGSYGYKGGDLRLANGGEKSYFNLFLNYAESDGYRKNSQQDQLTSSGRVGYFLDQGEVFADFAIYRDSAGQPGAIFSAAYASDPRSTRKPYDSESREGYRIRPGFSYQLNNNLKLEVEVAREHQQLDSETPSLGAGSRNRRLRDTTSLTPRLRWDHALGALPSETVVGLDYYDSQFDARYTTWANGGATQKSTAAYLQNVTALSRQLSLTSGFRTQQVVQTVHQDEYVPYGMTAMADQATRRKNAYDFGLAYAQNDWRVYGKLGTTFRFANLDELFGSDNLGNPVFAGNLKPQVGKISEIGGSLGIGAVKLRAALYQIRLHDEIGYDGNANANFAPTRRTGAEFEADWKVDRQLTLRAAYTHTEAKFRSGINAGNTLPMVPTHQATAQVVWDAGQAGSYSALARYVGERRYGGDQGNVRQMLAGYTTVDLQATWNLKPWKIAAKILNALDEKYSPFAGYSTISGDYFYYPADRRTFMLSGSYSF